MGKSEGGKNKGKGKRETGRGNSGNKKRSLRGRRLAIAACAAVVVVAVGIALAALQPWGAGGEGREAESPIMAVGEVEFDAGGEWVVEAFRGLAFLAGDGEYDAWEEVSAGDSWDFRVSAGDASASFRYDERFASAMEQRTGSASVIAFADALGEAESRLGNQSPFQRAEGSDALVEVAESGGGSASYADTAALRELAESLPAYRAEREAAAAEEEAEEQRLLEYYRENVFVAESGVLAVRGKIAIYFHGTTSEERVRQIAAEVGGTEVLHLKYREDPIIYHDAEGGMWSLYVKIPWGEEDACVARALEYGEVVGASCYEYVSLNGGGSEASAASIDSVQQYYLDMSGFTDAWDEARCDGAVSIGFVDTGLDYENGDIAENVDTGHLFNATIPEQGADADMTDVYLLEDGTTITHGTGVAAVASAVTGDIYGCDGASYNATIVSARMTDSSGSFDRDAVLDSLEYLIGLDDPPCVINMSLASSYPSEQAALADSYVQDLSRLVDEAWERGIVVVASSGNDGAGRAEGDAFTVELSDGSVHAGLNCYSYPACLDKVVSVGALAEPGILDKLLSGSYVPHLWEGSNTTSSVDVCAYGENIHTANAYATSVLDWFVTATGTSYAAPQVASAIALVKAKNPGYTASELVEAVESTCGAVCEADEDNPRRGFGHGTLDAAAAVAWEPESGGGSSSGGGSGGSTSPWTGGGGCSAEEVAAQLAMQGGVEPEGIPGALARACAIDASCQGWLRVPGTLVNLPVAKEPEGQADFYLDHAFGGAESVLGAAYVEASSSAGFADPVTPVYAHSYSGSNVMFGQLALFADPDFFESHSRFYVALPDGRTLSYLVASAAYVSDTRLASGPDIEKGWLQEYFDFFCLPVGCPANVRDVGDLDASRDRIVQLSTCTVPAVEGLRFVVTGVLEGEVEEIE